MGYSARTVRYRQTDWCPFSGSISGRRRRQLSQVGCYSESYDYVSDPWEQDSLSGDTGNWPGMRQLYQKPAQMRGEQPFDWAQLATVAANCATQNKP